MSFSSICLMIYRFIKHFLMFVLLSLPLTILGWVILAIYLPFHFLYIGLMSSTEIQLPFLLRWFDSADLYFGRDPSKLIGIYSSGLWNTYCDLAWRNPVNYFTYKILGFYYDAKKDQVNQKQYGNPDVGDNSQAGIYYEETNGYYQYIWVHKYSLLSNHCFYLRFGYKIDSLNSASVDKSQQTEECFTISPIKPYTGE